MSELLALPPASSGSTQHAQTQAAGIHAKLIKADFNGAMITGTTLDWSLICYAGLTTYMELIVKQSKNPTLVGLLGIVILETENTFKIVTQADQLKSKLLPICTGSA